ncbi:MAG TPA: mechanosensitive ion channel domain-containing protein [Rhizomicrobium sp.]|jgi:small-conductance mechanosensitive channel
MLSFLPQWAQAPAVFALIVACGFLLQAIAYRIAERRAQHWTPLTRDILRKTRPVGRFALFLFALALALPLVPLPESAQDSGHRILVAAFILLIGWIAAVVVNIWIERYKSRLRLDVEDNLAARKAVTQIRYLGRAAILLVLLLTAGAALMSFDTVRQFGISLFASAGVAGVAVGLAARPLLSNLIAGIQIALTQPIRIDDVVVINGEWGWVEEFTSTYVVIRLWDWRRQIVPLSFFFENAFTNWTRSSASIIGTVTLFLDYSAPVERVRAKAAEIVKATPLWDGKIFNVQVSDATEHTIQLRVLASAPNSAKTWNLRCEVREALLAYIQAELPGALPVGRNLTVSPALQRKSAA